MRLIPYIQCPFSCLISRTMGLTRRPTIEEVAKAIIRIPAYLGYCTGLLEYTKELE